jgi:hypothetical protein
MKVAFYVNGVLIGESESQDNQPLLDALANVKEGDVWKQENNFLPEKSGNIEFKKVRIKKNGEFSLTITSTSKPIKKPVT